MIPFFFFIRWTDITDVEKNHTLLRPETIKIVTRDPPQHLAQRELYFSMFMHMRETFSLIQQLTSLAMRKLTYDDSYQVDLDLLLRRTRSVPKKASFLKRDLDARKISEEYRTLFQVPNTEKLDGKVRKNTSKTHRLRLFLMGL